MNLIRSLVKATEPSYTTIVADLAIKSHLKVEIDDDDALILAYTKAACGLIEVLTNRQLLTCNYVARCDVFACYTFEIPRCPVSAISAVKYYDEDNVLQTLSTSVYETDLYSLPARISLKTGQSWPDIYQRMNAVQIEYTVGYANPAAIPFDLQHAIRLLTDHFYNNRSEVSSVKLHEIPLGIKALVLPFRIEKWDY